MRVWLALIITMALSSFAALAEYQDRGLKQVQSRHGLLQVSGDLGQQRIAFNGVDLGISDWSISIDGIWGYESAAHDWAVLTVHYGGNACDPPRILVQLSASGVAMTERLAECRVEPLDLRVLPDAIELDFANPELDISHETYRYDGTNVSKKLVALQASSPAGAGDDVLRWRGKHAYALTQDSAEQARFANIMTPEQFERFAGRLEGLGQPARREGDWITGSACLKTECGMAAAAWALRISDGLPMAVIYHADGRIEVFGKNLPHADPLVWERMHKRP